MSHRIRALEDVQYATPLPQAEPLIPQGEMVARIERIRRDERVEDCPTCSGSGKITPRGQACAAFPSASALAVSAVQQGCASDVESQISAHL